MDMNDKRKTKWLYTMKYNNGILRAGYNQKPDEDRPFDIVRLYQKTNDGEGDVDLHLTVGEAADVAAGLSCVIANRLDACKRQELGFPEVLLDDSKP